MSEWFGVNIVPVPLNVTYSKKQSEKPILLKKREPTNLKTTGFVIFFILIELCVKKGP